MSREIVRVVVGPIQCNCYIVTDKVSKKAYLIDPGAESRELLTFLEKMKVELEGVLITHAHLDHVGGIEMVNERFPAPVYYHAGDTPLFTHLDTQAESFGYQLSQLQARQPTVGDPSLRDGEDFLFAAGGVKVIHTPGHTPGSVCFYAEGPENVVFTGDTLFEGSIGRTDLWGGSFDQIMESIKTRLLTLPDEVKVLPGHGEFTSIARERAENPFLLRY